MNILVFSWRDPKHPLAGGAEQVMHQHMKGWIDAGHNVTLFSSHTKNLPRKENLDGVQIIRSGYHYLGVQIAGFFYYLKNRKNIDFIVDQFHGLPFFTPLYSRKPNLAVIQETAQKVWFLNPLPFPINYLIGAIGFVTEPFVYMLYKKTPILTASESAKKDIQKLGISSSQISIVPHGVMLPTKKPIAKKEKIFTIVFLGVHSKDKGVEDVIKCFELLDNKFQFWTIGKFETPQYEKYIKKISKNIDVKFWGFVSQEKKFELLSRAHVLVNPSAHEGWGLVNIEANSVGLPVVSYKNAGLTDSVKDNYSGILVNQNTPEELAKAVEDLQNNKTKYQKLSQSSIKWSESFSWDRSQKQSLDLITKIARNHLTKTS
jgi:glycosyltransferase involved in cell wall biosynthesis